MTDRPVEPVFKIDESSIILNTSGNVFGIIFLYYPEQSFPDALWTDFIVNVLSWWLEELLKLPYDPKMQAWFGFMDGPFHIDAVKDGQRLKMQCMKDRATGADLERTFEVSESALRANLLDLSERVLHLCKEKQWTSRDITRLKTFFEILRKQP